MFNHLYISTADLPQYLWCSQQKVLAKTVPAKLALVPKDRVRSMGMPLPPGLRKSVDADAWLKAQPVEYQQEVIRESIPDVGRR